MASCVGDGAKPIRSTATVLGRGDKSGKPRRETRSSSEAENIPAAKKTKVANLSVPSLSISTQTLFRDLAAGWIEKEMKWYAKAGYKPIDNKGEEKVADAHLKRACKEYQERFAFCTEQEEADSHCFSGSPYLLVAINVKSTWKTPDAFPRFRFALFRMQEDMSALFITLMPGPIHGSIDGEFSDMIGEYRRQNNLVAFVDKCHRGGGTYQPDISIAPMYPDPNPPPGIADRDTDRGGPQCRVVVEFEFGNRNADALREVGHVVLSHHYGSLFIGIKVWNKESAGTRNAGCFGAALVVWEKNHTTGVRAVRHALDFGTKPLSTQTKNAWNKAPTPLMLPRVPVATWVRPPPVPAQPVATPGQAQLGTPPGWSLDLPANAIFYRMPAPGTTATGGTVMGPAAGAGPGVGGAPAPPYLTAFNIPDFHVNLKQYQGQINVFLDKNP